MKKFKNLTKAVLINEKIRKKALEDWDSTEFIRRWREVRYEEGNGCGQVVYRRKAL